MTIAKGTARTWYEICNADGHALSIPQGVNNFQTEELAAQTAAEVCMEYRDTVTVVENTSVVKRIFEANVTAVEV